MDDDRVRRESVFLEVIEHPPNALIDGCDTAQERRFVRIFLVTVVAASIESRFDIAWKD
jgi:hypothetical protein